jgi:hypothetical protein
MHAAVAGCTEVLANTMQQLQVQAHSTTLYRQAGSSRQQQAPEWAAMLLLLLPVTLLQLQLRYLQPMDIQNCT